MKHTVAYLKLALRRMADPAFRTTQQSFSREPIRSLGVRTPDIRRLAVAAAREYRRARIPLPEIWRVAEKLWKQPNIEERALAIFILASFRSVLTAADFARLDRWIDSISNWAETDGLSIDLLGPLLGRHPALIMQLPAWTRSRNRWRRRAAAVALVPLARYGYHIDTAFAICDRLADDPDDLIEKAIGWLLKEASRTQPRLVVDYLLQNRPCLSRTTLRYACEKLPEKLRRRILTPDS